MQLSTNLSLEEFEHSAYANLYSIPNHLPSDQYPSAVRIATKLFQPIRDLLNVPLKITSGYRSKQLNEAVRGVSNSQHTISQAIDFIPSGLDIQEAFNTISKSDLLFDQLILEHDTKGHIWIHASLRWMNNRREIIPYLLKDNK